MDSVQRIEKINKAINNLNEAKIIGDLLAYGISKLGRTARYGYAKGKRLARNNPTATRFGRDVAVNVAAYKAMNFLQGGRESRIGAAGGGGGGAPSEYSQQYGSHTDMPGASPTLNFQRRMG
jgi:hypothetical protein